MRLLVSRHLEHFIALYAARNMHAAAERKGISQPALTKSLKLLEAELNTELFRRTRKGLEPTGAAHVLYRYASAIDQQARFASIDLPEYLRSFAGKLRIGVGPVLATSIFPAILVEFHKQFPMVEVTVETGISNRLVDALNNNDVDLIATARPEDSLGEEFETFSLFTSEMIVICRADHPLMRRCPVKLRDLSEYERVGFIEDREFEKKSSRAFGVQAQRMRPLLETTSMSIMFGILAATDYYAIVSHIMLPRARRDGLDQLAVQHDLWQIEIEMMCRGSLSGSRPVSAVRDLFMSHAGTPRVS